MKFAILTITVMDESDILVDEPTVVNVEHISEFHYIPREKKTIINLTGDNNYIYVNEKPHDVFKAIAEADDVNSLVN